MTEDTTLTRTEDEKARPLTKARRLLWMLPVLVFSVLAGFMLWGLDPNRDPSKIPSVLINKPVPEFDLAAVRGRELGLSTADLTGEVSLVNVFASWCTACRAEHPLLMQMKEAGVVPIHGLNYKDKPEDAAEWLDTLGDPYTRTGSDIDGRVGIEWGVYGVPETFVIDREGRIALKQIGAVTPRILKETIIPIIEELRKP